VENCPKPGRKQQPLEVENSSILRQVDKGHKPGRSSPKPGRKQQPQDRWITATSQVEHNSPKRQKTATSQVENNSPKR